MDERARVARDRAEGVSAMRGILWAVPASVAIGLSAAGLVARLVQVIFP